MNLQLLASFLSAGTQGKKYLMGQAVPAPTTITLIIFSSFLSSDN
jgi:hypothetical protein